MTRKNPRRNTVRNENIVNLTKLPVHNANNLRTTNNIRPPDAGAGTSAFANAATESIYNSPLIEYVYPNTTRINTRDPRYVAHGSYGCVVNPAYPNINDTGKIVEFPNQISKIFKSKRNYDKSMSTAQKVYEFTNAPEHKQYAYRRTFKIRNISPPLRMACGLNEKHEDENIYVMRQKNLGISIHQLKYRPDIINELRRVPLRTILASIIKTANHIQKWRMEGYIHGDIRETNVVIDLHGNISIIDIDLFETAPRFMYTYKHSYYSNPPETIAIDDLDIRKNYYLAGIKLHPIDKDGYAKNYNKHWRFGVNDKISNDDIFKIVTNNVNNTLKREAINIGFKNNKEYRAYIYGRLAMEYDTWGYAQSIRELLFVLYGDIARIPFTDDSDIPRLDMIMSLVPTLTDYNKAIVFINVLYQLRRAFRNASRINMVERAPLVNLIITLRLLMISIDNPGVEFNNYTEYYYINPFKKDTRLPVSNALYLFKQFEHEILKQKLLEDLHIIPYELPAYIINEFINELDIYLNIYRILCTKWDEYAIKY